MKLGTEVGLGPRPHCVRWGRPSSPSPKGTTPFSAYVHCGQMAGWIKVPPGMEVGLGPGDIVMEDPAPPKRSTAAPPHFTAMSVVAKRLDG